MSNCMLTLQSRINKQFLKQSIVACTQASVPADRLLIFDVKQGWAPLCEFLGRPVPAVPFPRGNEGTGAIWGYFWALTRRVFTFRRVSDVVLHDSKYSL